MARVKIENNELIINVHGVRKAFSLRSTVSIPLSSIIDVKTGLEWRELPNLIEKNAGTNAPNLYYGGTFVQDGNKVFYDLKKTEEAVVITLKDDEFERIVIGVENPEETVELIKNALGGS
jgi:hypothetical protein